MRKGKTRRSVRCLIISTARGGLPRPLHFDEFVVVWLLSFAESLCFTVVAQMIRLTAKHETFRVRSCACSVICLSSVLHHMGAENWETAAAGTLGRWAYPESKRAMLRLAKVLVE